MSRKPYPDSAAAAERPWRSGGKYGFRTNESPENGTCRPNVMARPVARPRAVRLGRYSSASAARRTLSLVSGATGRLPENTWETVVIDTPARRATSWIVAIDGPPMRHPARASFPPPGQFDAKALCPYGQPSDLLDRGRRPGSGRGRRGRPVEVPGGGLVGLLGPWRHRRRGHPGPRRRLVGTAGPGPPCGRDGAGRGPGAAPGRRRTARDPAGRAGRRARPGGLVHRRRVHRVRLVGSRRGVRVSGQHHGHRPGGAGHGGGVPGRRGPAGRAPARGAPGGSARGRRPPRSGVGGSAGGQARWWVRREPRPVHRSSGRSPQPTPPGGGAAAPPPPTVPPAAVGGGGRPGRREAGGGDRPPSHASGQALAWPGPVGRAVRLHGMGEPRGAVGRERADRPEGPRLPPAARARQGRTVTRLDGVKAPRVRHSAASYDEPLCGSSAG